jgi:5-methyltetrahydrofolate--homocysteine methyltransferase
LSDELRDGALEAVRQDYAKVRTAHEKKGDRGQRQPIATARANRKAIDWSRVTPPKPTFLGLKSFADYPLAELVERIDWTPFFRTWELAGTYPRILEDKIVGETASSLFKDAKEMLARIVGEGLLEARAVIGFFPANRVGEDDIALYAGDDRETVRATIHTLRQQMAREAGRPNLALADFVAPADSGLKDYIGAFAVTAGIGTQELATAYEKQHDDYSSIMVKALADRLAEAFAERMHERVRKEFWGYAADEALDNDALIQERYQGIRPAPGYPACPDHTEKATLFSLLEAEARAGIRLTEGFAMMPASSVSGFYFWHPEAEYFGVGRIDKDQVEDYARRKGMDLLTAERWLAPNLSYDR